MIDWNLARRYQSAGLGLGGVLLKQSLYPRARLLSAFEGAEVVLDLGCGEGLLTNTLAAALPRTRFVGIDLNTEKIRLAQSCAVGPNVEFSNGNLFDASACRASAVLFNDVLHHLPSADQDRALAFASDRLDGAGVLVLKEVAADDRLDRAHTSFWDGRLYPQDRLEFRTLPDWIALAGRHGFRLLDQCVVKHPWIASRSVLTFTQRPRHSPNRSRAATIIAGAPVRVLVTGGTGFIGGWLVHELLGSGLDGRAVEIGVVTRRPWSLPQAVAADARVKIIPVDLAASDPDAALSGPWDYVFHLAADVDYFGGAATYRNNVDATAHLIASLRGTSVKRFVYASTMGALDRARFDPCKRPLDEESSPHPTSPYGRAKVIEEKLVRESGLPFTIVRIPWCYGPGMARSHHVRRLLGNVRRNSFALRWAWPGKVSLIEASAAAKTFVAAATSPAVAGQTFFISDGAPVSFAELFAEMGAVVGNPRAGHSHLPVPLTWLGRHFHFLLPFQLKALLCDALQVSDARARQSGISTSQRGRAYLDPLAQFDAGENWPSRAREFAVLTGAASGIGRALARQLAARGHGLCLVDRDEKALAETAAVAGGRATILDLAELEPDRVAAQLAGPHAARVSLVINNAGLGFRGGHAELDSKRIESMLAVNVRAVTLSTAAFAREMERSGGGTIVNIASSAAYQPLPYMAVYAASKAFVLSFTLAAGAERKPGARIRLLAVSPSGTRTNFQTSGGVKVDEKEQLATPEATAAEILRAVERGHAATIIGRRGRAMALFARMMPTARLVRTWEQLMRRAR